jgi:hypothetical protein
LSLLSLAAAVGNIGLSGTLAGGTAPTKGSALAAETTTTFLNEPHLLHTSKDPLSSETNLLPEKSANDLTSSS